jgi:hypothetical protein
VSACETIEGELRQLTTLIAATRRHVESLGSGRDSTDLRRKMDDGVQRARAMTVTVGRALKAELPPLVEQADLSAREKASVGSGGLFAAWAVECHPPRWAGRCRSVCPRSPLHRPNSRTLACSPACSRRAACS